MSHLEIIASQQDTEIQKDEDYFFVMSLCLLPHLRLISEERKLHTRIKIQQLIIEEKQLDNQMSTKSASVSLPSPSPSTSWIQTPALHDSPLSSTGSIQNEHECILSEKLHTNDPSLSPTGSIQNKQKHIILKKLRPVRSNNE
ncbi:hypothetical protein ABEB36_015072 [Hypothenemus hampei]|uniref:BESS domain-containing protein n=1 Tax=Hypothenemus hampei TaxID=57062 RepID=A0ABD1E0M1_HYPHA